MTERMDSSVVNNVVGNQRSERWKIKGWGDDRMKRRGDDGMKG